MSSPFDLLKSYVRDAASRARDGIERAAPMGALRKRIAEAARQRSAIDERALSRAIAHAKGVEAASVVVRGGAVRIDATFDDGEHLAMSLVPAGATFAPRGAKEIRFRVDPADAAKSPHAGDLAAAVAGCVARALWAVVLRSDGDLGQAQVDRDQDLFRIDLRTIPEVRALGADGPHARILDVLAPAAITADEGALHVQLQLPKLG